MPSRVKGFPKVIEAIVPSRCAALSRYPEGQKVLPSVSLQFLLLQTNSFSNPEKSQLTCCQRSGPYESSRVHFLVFQAFPLTAPEVGRTGGPTAGSGLGYTHGSRTGAEELPSSPTGHDARPPLPRRQLPRPSSPTSSLACGN